ncbi:MAG: GNAT family N-acetyltransferase [Oscillospiraceae bacterium]
MEIRLMRISDYEQVYQLWLSCAGMGLNNLDDSKEGIERFLNRNPETCFVAEKEKKIIGVILVGNDGRRGYIYHTAVSPDHRHQGIAAKLVDTSTTALKSLGINKAALVVFSKNEDGNAFWKKNGFISRKDLVYRNKTLTEMIRIGT